MQIPLALPVPADRDGLAAILTRFGCAVLQEVSRPEVLSLHRLAIAEAERSPDLAQTLDKMGREANHRALAALLDGAQATGAIGRGDTQQMVGQFVGLLWGGLMIRLLLRVADPPDPVTIERQAQAAAAALLTLYPAGSVDSEAGR
jgi:hypothetical protein